MAKWYNAWAFVIGSYTTCDVVIRHGIDFANVVCGDGLKKREDGVHKNLFPLVNFW